MSELINPGVEMMPDVPEGIESVIEEASQPAVNYSEKNLAELVKLFEELVQNEERMKMSKDAEAIKSAFYKRLQKEKADAGIVAVEAAEAEVETENPFMEIERGFKEIYNAYKKERAEHNRQIEKERENNLALKEAVIADLKALLEKQEDVNATFPEFREIQNRWRAVGPVPAQNYRNINETYQLYVEQFYDMVKINRELRDLDFKKNLEAKEEFCAFAEKLAENPNVVEAFRELQKLHEQWKEFGPVAKEYRDQIWDRFKAATALINKKYQAFFEEQKEQQAENLAKKTVLCEKVEEIAEREVLDSNQWNAFSKEIEDIQKEWKTIGFASKKDNQKIYDIYPDLMIVDAFKEADNVLTTAVKGITEIITVKGYINVDMADVKMVMKQSGVAIMGMGRGSGENRAITAVEEAFKSPLLNDFDLKTAKNALVNISSNEKNGITSSELRSIMEYIHEYTGNDIEKFKRGVVIDNSLPDGCISITVVATGFRMHIQAPAINKSKISEENILTLTDETEEDPNKIELSAPVSNETTSSINFRHINIKDIAIYTPDINISDYENESALSRRERAKKLRLEKEQANEQ